MAIREGTTLGPYTVIAPLGAGGMGEVYRARDTRLKRDVAIKVLPDATAANEESLSRFQREAEAIAALSHPNILAIYDVGRENNRSYVVTELLEGETLRQSLLSGPLPWKKAVEFSCAIVDGLAAAHGKGITHRDLKPENIFLTNDGVVKILDFGLARIEAGPRERGADEAHTPTVTLDTRPGTVIGTLNYMSPEQLRGKPTDPRTDIFSFGCVLFEMITGERAFKGDSPADTMTAILRETPEGVRSTHAEVGLELERVIDRCLEKKPDQRFHSSVDLAFTLRSILAGSGTVTPVHQDRSMLGLGIPITLATMILVGAAGYMGYRAWSDSAARTVAPPQVATLEPDRGTGAPSSTASTKKVRVAVLPFDDTSQESQEWLANGMTEAVIDDLAKISGLRVISHTSVKQYRGTSDPIPAIGEALNVDFIVEGSVLRDGDRVRIVARLLDAKTDQQIWSQHHEHEMSDIIALQHDVAEAIVNGIQVELTPEEAAQLAQRPRVNTRAIQLYMRGLEAVRRGTESECQLALKLFDSALEEDPDFALAHVGRAQAYEILSSDYLPPKQAMPQVREAALRALELDSSLAEAHVMLGQYKLQYEWDFEGAQKEYEKAIESSPNSAEARLGYAIYLSAMDRGDEALRQLDLVQEYDPASRDTDVMHGVVSFMAHDYLRTIHDAEAAMAENPNWWAAHQWMGLASSQLGNHKAAIYHAREAARLNPSPTWLAMAGGVLAVAGETEEALEIYDSLKKAESTRYVCPYEMATIPLGLGDYDTTFEDMDQACEARADCLAWLQVDPRVDPIRDDPRFDRLLRRVGFEPKGGLKIIPRAMPDKTILAVLPFEPANSNTDTVYLKGEIPASIIHTLSALSDLQVIPRSTAFRYKVDDRDISKIGGDLGATVVLTGSINTHGNALIIRAELIDVGSDRELWSQRYNRKLDDIMAIEESIAKEISDALRLQLTGEEQDRLTKRYTENAEAYQLYLNGRFWWNKRTQDGFDKAIALFDKAIAIDPNYSLAYAGKADCYCLAGYYFQPPRETMPLAKEAIDAALALDPKLSEAYATRGWVRTLFDWDWAGAERDFLRAIELNPRYATAHHWYSIFLNSHGRLDEAQREITRASELDRGSLIIQREFASNMALRRQYDLAIERYRKSLAIDPTFVPIRLGLAETLSQSKQYDQAIAEIKRVYEETGRPPRAAGLLGAIYAAAGRADLARQELQTLTSLSKKQYVPAIGFARIHAELGDFDTAFASMDEAFEARDGSLAFLAVSPWFDALRNDPRFDNLLRRVGLQPLAPE